MKGANKLARNKKGRKPGDVFSPTVEEHKKERIKEMLGMGAASQQDVGPAAGSATSAAAPPAAVAAPVSAATAGGAGRVSAAGGVESGGGSSGVSGSATTAATPATYKVQEHCCLSAIQRAG